MSPEADAAGGPSVWAGERGGAGSGDARGSSASPPPLGSLAGRIAGGLALTVSAIVAYRLVGFGTDPAEARVLRTALDDAIPFWPASVYAYSWVYTSMLFPLFTIRDGALFARTLGAFALAIGTSLAIWAVLPVTSVGFRPDPSTLDPSILHEWGVMLTYWVDPPTNLFPSLHLSAATLAALAAGKARRAFGWVAAPVVVGVAITICTMKQHYVVDGVAALVVAVLAYGLILAPWQPPEGAGTGDRAGDGARPVAYGWGGPALYLAFHASVYACLIGAWYAGLAPWDR